MHPDCTTLAGIHPCVAKVDLSSGSIVQEWTGLSKANDEGAGIAVIGDVMYYTVRGSLVVRKYDLVARVDIPSEFFKVNYTPPLPCSVYFECGLEALAYDPNNRYLYISNGSFNTVSGCPLLPLGEVFVYDISNAKSPQYIKTITRSMVTCAPQGLDYFVQNAQDLLVSNRYSDSQPYDLYDTNGVFQKTLITSSPDKYNSGIVWDGTYFYTSSHTPGEGFPYYHLDVFSSSGVYIKKISLTGVVDTLGAASDLSIPYPDPALSACEAVSSHSVLINLNTVTAYVPRANWGDGTISQKHDIVEVQVEPKCGNNGCPKVISTGANVNSCASNPVTLQTVCTANDNTVYVISDAAITNTLQSAAVGHLHFSGGDCTNCGITMDPLKNIAWIALSYIGGTNTVTGGFQPLYLSTTPPTLGDAFESLAGSSGFPTISEGILVDPMVNWIASPSEDGNYELIAPTNAFVGIGWAENSVDNAPHFDSAAEDCSEQILLASIEHSYPPNPAEVWVGDLSQITGKFGKPGTWNAPAQIQPFLDSSLPCGGGGGISVAQGTHLGVMADEFGCDGVIAFEVPTMHIAGSAPMISNYVMCHIGQGFVEGADPHTVTAYRTPDSSGDAIALLANNFATSLARVDLTKMLALPRAGTNNHLCASGTLPASVVSFIGPF